MKLLHKQLVSGLCSALAIAIVFLVWRSAPTLFADTVPPGDDLPARIAFVATWLIVPGLTLLAGILGASRRGFYEDAIDGTRTPKSHSLEINLRYNTNTVEQVVLATIAWVCLAVTLPRQHLVLIPAMAWLFAVGRITFWIGYAFHPIARTFGMAMTAVPTLLAYGWLVWQKLV